MRKKGLIKDKNIESAIRDVLKSTSRARIYLYLLRNNGAKTEQIINGSKLHPSTVRETLSKMNEQKIIYRKKQGFTFPLEVYLRKELKTLIKDNLLEKSELHKYVNKDYINKLLKLHYKKEKNYTNGLWTIFVLKKWLDQYLNNG